MSNSPASLTVSASAVAGLGVCQGDIDRLDDPSLVAGMRLVRELEDNLQPYKLWLAAAITRRSSHELGYEGLARKNGSPTPAVFIQTLTGGSLDEAARLARLGSLMVEEQDVAGAHGAVDGDAETGPVATAAIAGDLTLGAADAIHRGLGAPDDAVTAGQLRAVAAQLVGQAAGATPEALAKLARQRRSELDLAAVERGQKHRADLRHVRTFARDGMHGGSWLLPDEDGGLEIHTALKLLLATRTDGPRFPATDTDGNPIIKSAAGRALEDTRTNEQVLADGFTHIFLNGLHADPSVVPGASRAAVRVLVTQETLDARRSGDARPGLALLEDSLSPVTFAKLEEYLCEGGTIGVLVDDDGEPLDVGREQRLFTRRQRTGLAVRDGGCRFPRCQKPPSWCEAHHIAYWARDRGKTDILNGILLCRYHHMFIHNKGWDIHHDHGTYWLKPPADVDPQRALVEMPSKNPLIAAMKHASRERAETALA
jgi:hypothetical protein